ncbi:MAG: PP2C family protein-serine/threonine phosphatase [Halochromatium sp.]
MTASDPHLLQPPEVACLSETGLVRSHNEDAYAAQPELGLWVVADGMGGVAGGEVASAIAVETIVDEVRRGAALTEALNGAHRAILDAAAAGQGSPGMGTTAVALRLDRHRYELAWVGDSRAYSLDQGQSLRQLTRDHSVVQSLVDQGLLSPEQAGSHPDRHQLTRALGGFATPAIDADHVSGDWSRGDWLLLCTDGLNGELSDVEIGGLIQAANAPEPAAQALVAAALERGGHDNLTLILLRR